MNLSRKKTKIIVILGIIVLIAVCAAVVSFLKQNNINEKLTDTTDRTSSQTLLKNKAYENGFYSFEYDPTKWKIDEKGYSGKYDRSSRIMTLNYAVNEDKTIADGAEISVLIESSNKTLNEVKDSSFSILNAFGVQPENVQTIKISNNVPAISYESQGLQNRSSKTIFVKDNYTYVITYQIAKGKDPSLYIDGYKMVVSSFKFK